MTTDLEIFRAYEKMDARFETFHLSEKVSYVTPINFVESMQVPRHRWFPYKEGFSPSFVNGFLAEFGVTSGTVFDPFSGVGSTGITAAMQGLPAFGVDSSPLATFVAQTKAIHLDAPEFRELNGLIDRLELFDITERTDEPANPTVVGYFDPEYLDAMLRVKFALAEVPSKAVRDLGLLALLACVERFSTHRKAGNGVKRKTSSRIPPVDKFVGANVGRSVSELLRTYRSDILKSQLIPPPEFNCASALDEQTYTQAPPFSAAVTSPPYANCFDYSKIYLRELWIGDFFTCKEDQDRFRAQSVRSHVHATWASRNDELGSELLDTHVLPVLTQSELWSPRIPTMLEGYFQDIDRVLRLVHRNLERGGVFGLVVGNSLYGGIPIATDLLIADMAERSGYVVKRIDVYRKVIPSSQQFQEGTRMDWSRESNVILEKP